MESAQVKVIYRRERWNPENVFRWAMLVTMAVPPIVLVWYAYTSDFQAQGRYVMPAVIPVMYFVTLGYEQWFSGIFKKRKRPADGFSCSPVCSLSSARSILMQRSSCRPADNKMPPASHDRSRQHFLNFSDFPDTGASRFGREVPFREYLSRSSYHRSSV